MAEFSKSRQTGRERPAPVKGGGLRRRSVKMEEALDEYAVKSKRYLMLHRECAIQVRGTCKRWSKEIHHRAGREGPWLMNEEFWAATCRPCHVHVELNREWGKAKGWLVRRTVSK